MRGATHFSIVDVCDTDEVGTTFWRAHFILSEIALQPPAGIDAAPQVLDLNGDGHLTCCSELAIARTLPMETGARLPPRFRIRIRLTTTFFRTVHPWPSPTLPVTARLISCFRTDWSSPRPPTSEPSVLLRHR